MRSTYAIIGLAMSLGLAGCASGLPHGKPVDYNNLPGENDSAQGPGLLSGDHYDKSDGGGTLLYSDNHPSKSVFGSLRDRNKPGQAPTENAGQGSSQTSASAARSQQDFQNFQDFQAYKHFQQLPPDSPEKQRFKDWKEWQEYKKWKQQQQ
ncbi:hypothetical protein SAHY_09173 [Salinisphaera hydrothermalis EPR70]